MVAVVLKELRGQGSDVDFSWNCVSQLVTAILGGPVPANEIL